MVLDRAQYGRYPVTGDAAFAYSGDTLDVRDAMIGMGPALVALDGSVDGVRMGAPMAPQYDLNATLRAADAHALIALTQPKLARQYIEGSIDADVHVGGSGRAPLVSGAFDVPEGSVHGLAFRNLRGTLGGTAQDFNVSSGHVTIGSTVVAFNAAGGAGSIRATSRPRAQIWPISTITSIRAIRSPEAVSSRSTLQCRGNPFKAAATSILQVCVSIVSISATR